MAHVTMDGSSRAISNYNRASGGVKKTYTTTSAAKTKAVSTPAKTTTTSKTKGGIFF